MVLGRSRERQLSCFFIGSFPPPLHGAAILNGLFAVALKEMGLQVVELKTNHSQLRRSKLSLAVRTMRYFIAICKLTTSSFGKNMIVLVGLGAGLSVIGDAVVLAVARGLRARCCVFHHSSKYVCNESTLFRILLWILGKEALHIACSEQMLLELRGKYSVVDHLRPISNAAWIKQPRIVYKKPDDNAALRIGFLSNLSEEKGLFRALETLQLLHERNLNVEMWVAGAFLDQKTKSQFQIHSLVREGYVKYWGVVDEKMKSRFFEGIDVFLFPSTYVHETQSLVVPEALSFGCTVVALRHRYVAEILEGASGSLIVDKEDEFGAKSADFCSALALSRERLHAASMESQKIVQAARRLARHRLELLCDELKESGKDEKN